MQYTQHLTIDIYKQEQFQYIHAVQYDHCARQLVVTPTANGEPLTIPSTATAVFRCLKHDGTSVVNPATVDASAGTITFELTDQALACEGMARADVSIIDGETILSTLTFFIMVEKAATSSEQIQSSNEFLYIVQVAGEVEGYTERAEAAAESAAEVAKSVASISEEVEEAKAALEGTAANARAAAASEQNAINAADTATAKAAEAAASAAAAKTSETNAASVESTVVTKAEEATASAAAALESKESAAASEAKASAAATIAETSATAAASSAATAETSASAASGHASTAGASATAAANSAAAAESAKTAAEEAKAAAEQARDEAQDIVGGDFATKAALSAHTDNTTVHITAEERTAWNGKSDFSGDYNDLTNKPAIPTVPTNVSAFTNDAGYLTEHQDISGKADKTDLTGHTDNTTVHITAAERTTWNNKSNFSGNYNDLTNKPTIPTVPVQSVNSKTGAVQLSASDVGAAPAYTYGTADLTAGTSSLETGKVYFVYE